MVNLLFVKNTIPVLQKKILSLICVKTLVGSEKGYKFDYNSFIII